MFYRIFVDKIKNIIRHIHFSAFSQLSRATVDAFLLPEWIVEKKKKYFVRLKGKKSVFKFFIECIRCKNKFPGIPGFYIFSCKLLSKISLHVTDQGSVPDWSPIVPDLSQRSQN